MQNQNPKQITITAPDDWHLHVRDGDVLRDIVPHTAAQFSRALIMPNLKPPVTSTQMALDYQARIKAAAQNAGYMEFQPLMSLYLTDNTNKEEIEKAAKAGIIALKLYPAGATTNSDAGVTDIKKTYPALEAMQKAGLKLLIHGEVTEPEIDIFDREAVFIEKILEPLRKDMPALKIVLEHITTKQAAQYITSAGDAENNLSASITAHHLLFNRNAIFTGGLSPHYYCLPVLKREEHRLALIDAATSGANKFFAGTDSAPHPAHLKEHASGCAGCYTAMTAVEMYTTAFEKVGALDKLEKFMSFNGADFYQLPRNKNKITLEKQSWQIPEKIKFGQSELKPLQGGQEIGWKIIKS